MDIIQVEASVALCKNRTCGHVQFYFSSFSHQLAVKFS